MFFAQSLASLSEDNQVLEIVKKVQKSLDLLDQHATRIASKAEMLGAVHQVGYPIQNCKESKGLLQAEFES